MRDDKKEYFKWPILSHITRFSDLITLSEHLLVNLNEEILSRRSDGVVGGIEKSWNGTEPV